MSFLKNVLKETSNEYGTIAADGLATSDVAGYVDTGSFVFNALVSGSLHGGLPQNKITALAGESATGKTFFVLGVVKAFLESDPKAQVVFFESENSQRSFCSLFYKFLYGFTFYQGYVPV